ncbi:MAG: mandelate racemase [Nocardioidaceae bacterium]|nr:mandelate racemase [Nocardioidaceae bacterium]NUS52801.1 mandelate racemase [Nocardioidaceae bacterium]
MIGSVRTRVYTVPTGDPDVTEADGTLAWASTTLDVVEVTAGDSTGVGWTYGPPACADVVDATLADVVTGRDPLDVPAAHEAMVRQLRNQGRPGIGAMALSAVDTALWDLKARLLGLPLHRLLGAVRDDVPVYGSGGFTTYTDRQLVDQLDSWCSAGVSAVKIKVGESWGSRQDRDAERVRVARAAVGPDVDVFVDANGAYTAAGAVRWYDRVREQGVSWFEEPVSSDDLDGLRRVREEVDADVTAGEYGYDLTYFARMLDAGAVDCLQVDVSRCGGITEWLRVVAVAASHHVEVSAHCAPNLHASVAAATPGLRHVEWFHDHTRIEGLLFHGACTTPRDGAMPLGDAPGNGLELDVAAGREYRVR